MPFNLLKYWKLGLAAVMLIVIAAMYLRLAACLRHSEAMTAQLATANGRIAVQNEAVGRMEVEGRLLEAKVGESKRRGEVAIASARSEAARLRTTAPNGCPTPSEVMTAYR